MAEQFIFTSLFNSTQTKDTLESEQLLDMLLIEVEKVHGKAWHTVDLDKIKPFQTLVEKDGTTQKALVRYLIDILIFYRKNYVLKRSWPGSDMGRFHEFAYLEILAALLKKPLDFSFDALKSLFESYQHADAIFAKKFADWPIVETIIQIEKHLQDHGLDSKTKTFLKDLMTWPQMKQEKNYWGTDLETVGLKVENMLFKSENETSDTAPYILADDRFGQLVNNEVESMHIAHKNALYALFHDFIKTKGSEPGRKFLKGTSTLIEQIGLDTYIQIVQPWLEFVADLDNLEIIKEQTISGKIHQYSIFEFIHKNNQTFLKGLVWSLASYSDAKTLETLAKLVVRSYQKIPGVGPAATGLGNACLYVLEQSKTKVGFQLLSKLQQSIKHKKAKARIAAYLDQ